MPRLTKWLITGWFFGKDSMQKLLLRLSTTVGSTLPPTWVTT